LFARNVLPSSNFLILGEFNSGAFLDLKARPIGTYEKVSEIKGNAILSSVYVRAIDPGATLKVNYYDTTTGATFGERFELTGHDLIDDTAAGETFRRFVTQIHRRVVCEAIVTGGNVDFSVYATVVTAFSPQDIQAITGEVSTSGLQNGGRITEVTIDSTTWSALPAVALADRNAIGIQNPSGTEIKINYDPLVFGYVGVVIPAGGERFMDIKDNILVYAKSQSGSVTLNIEEIS
jgi:hypothetical protein